jgi:hypothetical protein
LALETVKLTDSTTSSNTTPAKHCISWAIFWMHGKSNKTNGVGNKAIPMWFDVYWDMPSEALESYMWQAITMSF